MKHALGNRAGHLLDPVPVGTAAAFVFPYLVILVIIAAYVIHIPFAVRSQRWVAAHPEAWNDRPRQQRAARRAIRRSQHPRRRSVARLGLRKPGR